MGGRVVAFLRRHHANRKVAEGVAADTGLPVSTVRKWLEGAAVPNGFALVRLAWFYGPEFLCALSDDPPRWLQEAARAEDRERLRAQIAELQARLDAS